MKKISYLICASLMSLTSLAQGSKLYDSLWVITQKLAGSELDSARGKRLRLFDDTAHSRLSPIIITGNETGCGDMAIAHSDTCRIINIVGVYGDGSLKMFPAKYIINKTGKDLCIIGVAKSHTENLVGIYSYEDQYGLHFPSLLLRDVHKKGDRKINWVPDGK